MCQNLRAFWEDIMDPKSAVGGPKQISRTGMVSSKNKCSLLLIILEMSGSLTASTVLSAYQRAAVATQQKTNAVTIFFQVLFN